MNAKYPDLAEKLAVVTGATRGIGFGIAAALAESGTNIIAISKSAAADSRIGDLVRRHGRTFEAISCDFGDRAAVLDVASEVERRAPDIIVNNAGSIQRAPATEYSLEQWDEMINTNLTAPFILTQAAGRPMVERGSGKVIFTASLLSYQGGINALGYAAAKSGIASLTRSFSNEWASKGVNVNALVPGYIDTDNTKTLVEDPVRSVAILDRIPFGRWGTGTDLGGAAAFLASEASDYITGALLPVDGGWLAR